jgi:hypothetical protein
MATALAAATLLSATAWAQTPLRVATTNLPLGAVGTPYSATLSATGGTPPCTWRLVSSEPHVATVTTPGTYDFDEYDPAPGWSCAYHDWWSDGSKDIALPFGFPFFGTVYTNVKANALGALTFTDSLTYGQSYSEWTFNNTPMIAVFWPYTGSAMPGGGSSLPIDATPGDLWLKASDDEVTILWLHSTQTFASDYYNEFGEPYYNTFSASYSATLRADGTIVMKYASENESLDPDFQLSGCAALSAGDGGATTVWDGSTDANTDTAYAPSALPAGLECTAAGVLQGTPAETGEHFLVAVAADATGAFASQPLVLGIAGDGMAWDSQGKWTYTVTNGVATVTSGPSSGDIAVPAALAGIPVGAIGLGAFSGCTNLASIALPDSVTAIGDHAFSGCTALTNAALGNGLSSLGAHAFRNCSALSSIALPDGVTAIPPYAFVSCSALATVTLGGHVASIGNYAFDHCSALAAVNLPSTLQSIGEYAFEYCSGLSAVDFPASLATIGQYAFHSSGLRNLFVPATVSNLASRAFWESRNLTNVVFGTGTKSVPWGIFDYCTALASVTLPEGLVSIGSIAFRGCSSLVSVDFPSTIATIGERAFDECKGLASVTLPDSVTSIGNYTFRKCSALTNAVVGTGVSAIPAGLFESCSSLSSVTLSPALSSIGSTAFYLCTSLAVPPALDGVVSIGDSAFSYCAFTDIAIPSSVTNLGSEVFRKCSALTNAVVEADISAIPSSLFNSCSSLVSVSLPSSISSIGSYAFYGCSALPAIELPASLQSIGMYAFRNCTSLAGIAFPASLTAVAADAFASCTGLTAVYTPSLDAWLAIAFANATANPLTYAHRLVVGDTDLADLALPAGLAAVPPYAFSGATGLVSVAFGDAASIGAGAFANCTGLAEVSIPDDIASVGANAFSGCTGLARAEVPAAWWGTTLAATAGFPATCTVVYRGMEPLVMLTTNLPPAVAGVPYSTALAASGGTTPYAWSLAVPAVYAESASESSTYEEPDGETEPTAEASWFYGSHCYVELPFAFPFFGRYYTNLFVNANGIVSFGSETSYWGGQPSISAFGEDCTYFNGWDGTIQVFVSAGEVTAFWMGSYYPDYWEPSTYYVNFSVTLRPDGSITMKYGQIDNNDFLYPSIGLFDGGETGIYTTRENLYYPSGMADIVFTLPPWPDGLSWTPDGLLLGTPTAPGAYEIVATVADASGVALTNTFPLVVADGAAATTNSPVPVPHAWIVQNAPDILADADGDFEAAALADAPIGRPVWECWLTGADTAADGTDFTASFDIASDGTWTVSWSPDLNDGLAVPVRSYHVLAKQTPADSVWTDVTDTPSLPSTAWRFFRVSVSLP